MKEKEESATDREGTRRSKQRRERKGRKEGRKEGRRGAMAYLQIPANLRTRQMWIRVGGFAIQYRSYA